MYRLDDFINDAKIRDCVREALKKSGSKERLAKDLGVRYRTVLSWFKDSTPGRESLSKLVDYLSENSSDDKM